MDLTAGNTDAGIRIATEADALELAVLKVHWSQANNPDYKVDLDAARAFAEPLREWMRERGEQSVCVVASVDGRIVGMAWLSIFHRAPDVGDVVRLSGDVQSVFVLPAHRGRGIGQVMVQGLVDEADARGIRRVTVSSSTRARPVYERVGFRVPERILARELGGAL